VLTRISLTVTRFDTDGRLGESKEFLSEPKHDVYFDAPERPLSLRAFSAAARRQGVRLDRRAQWLFDDDALYVNGEARSWPRGARDAFAALANARSLSPAQARRVPDNALAILHGDYRNGSLHIG